MLWLVTLLLCSLPMSTTFSQQRDWCGPHKQHTMTWAISEEIKKSPSWVKSVIDWVTNPMILGGLALALAFAFIFQKAQKIRHQKNAKDFKIEFNKYRSAVIQQCGVSMHLASVPPLLPCNPCLAVMQS